MFPFFSLLRKHFYHEYNNQLSCAWMLWCLQCQKNSKTKSFRVKENNLSRGQSKPKYGPVVAEGIITCHPINQEGSNLTGCTLIHHCTRQLMAKRLAVRFWILSLHSYDASQPIMHLQTRATLLFMHIIEAYKYKRFCRIVLPLKVHSLPPVQIHHHTWNRIGFDNTTHKVNFKFYIRKIDISNQSRGMPASSRAA